ncbi:MAG: histidine phosphatase family protein [Nocardioidaceae bacterium]|nr:histidine phosphatase family protein [Nocardioidaceae bacterium]
MVVVRHGQTAWNAAGRFQGRSDEPLDDVGAVQAQAAARKLSRLGPHAVLTSDSTRARQTADPLAVAAGLTPVPDPRLREVDIGAWEGLTRAEVQARFPEEYAGWRQGRDVRRGGGETLREAGERAESAVRERLQDGTLVVVTHAGTGTALLGRMLRLAPETWRSLAGLSHGRWSVLEEASYGWRLEQHNVRPPRGFLAP